MNWFPSEPRLVGWDLWSLQLVLFGGVSTSGGLSEPPQVEEGELINLQRSGVEVEQQAEPSAAGSGPASPCLRESMELETDGAFADLQSW